MLTPHLSLKAPRPRGPPLANCPPHSGQQVAPGLHRPDPERPAGLRRPKSPRKGACFPGAAAPIGRRSKGANGPQLLPTVRARPTPRFPRKTREPSRGGPLRLGQTPSRSEPTAGGAPNLGVCSPRPPRRKGGQQPGLELPRLAAPGRSLTRGGSSCRALEGRRTGGPTAGSSPEGWPRWGWPAPQGARHRSPGL